MSESALNFRRHFSHICNFDAQNLNYSACVKLYEIEKLKRNKAFKWRHKTEFKCETMKCWLLAINKTAVAHLKEKIRQKVQKKKNNTKICHEKKLTHFVCVCAFI